MQPNCPRDIINKAKWIEREAKPEDYEDEAWFWLSDKWRLSLKLALNGELLATIYPIVDGETDLSQAYVI